MFLKVMMKTPSMLIFSLLLIRQITIGSTTESSRSNLSVIIQSTLTNTAINSSIYPIDIENISNKMASGSEDVQSLTTKLLELTAIPTLNADNLLNLLVVVHDTFDVIIATARGLEHKLSGIIGSVDLTMTNVQIALQNLIQTIVVNVIITDDTRNTTQNDINYSLLGIVDGIQLLLDTSYRLLSGIVTLPGNDLAKSMSCLEGIVQTILSITENLLHSLRLFLQNFKIDSSDGGYIMPMLDVALTNSLNELARDVTHPVTRIVKESLESTLQAIMGKLNRDLGSVTESTLNSIKQISTPINDLLATISEGQKVTATRTLKTMAYITRTLPSNVLSITNEIKSIQGNTIGVQSTLNVAISNTIASIHSLTSYLSLITSLLLENVVKVHMRAMQTLLNGVSEALRHVLPDYSKSLLLAAVNIKHTLGDLGNVIEDLLAGSIGGSISSSNGRLNDAIKGFKMVVDNVDNLRINLRNTFRAMERFLS